jgi:hypothetical protein
VNRFVTGAPRCAADSGATRLRLRTGYAFWLPLAVVSAVVMICPPHTVDGPAHVLGAQVLADWHSEPIYRHFYRLSMFPAPNLAAGLLLAGLVRLIGLRGAETTILVACVVALPLALRYAVTAVRPHAGWTGIAALPFAFNYLYAYGFYNFCLGLALCLCCAGAVLRAAPDWPIRSAVRVAALLVATWFTHLVAFAAALLFLGAVAACGPKGPRRFRAPVAVALPGLALSACYVGHTSQGAGPHWSGQAGLLVGLLSLHTQLVTYSVVENVVAVALALALATVAVRTRRSGEFGAVRWEARAAGAAALAAVLVYLVAPENLGIDFGLINERLSFFPVLFGLLWLLIRPIPTRWAAIAVASALAATAGLAVVRLPELRREDRLAAEYLSAARFLKPRSTLVALRFVELTPDAGRNSHWDAMRHLSSGLAAQEHSIDVEHYEAVFDYFPAQFRTDRNLRRAIDPSLTGLEQVPPMVDLDAATAVDGRPIDYVLVVAGPRVRPGAAVEALTRTRSALARRYTRLGVTTPSGLVEVWSALPAAGPAGVG